MKDRNKVMRERQRDGGRRANGPLKEGGNCWGNRRPIQSKCVCVLFSPASSCHQEVLLWWFYSWNHGRWGSARGNGATMPEVAARFQGWRLPACVVSSSPPVGRN